MINLLTLIGARPQIIKAAALSREVAQHFDGRVAETILHTGQHYDDNMSGHFFSELHIPRPHINLGVGSASHGVQTARIIEGVERELMTGRYDGLVLFGDTNSTLAGAVAATKLHVPVFHIEAGLRSYDMTMPEEANRCVCDLLSTLLFAPTQTAVDNLRREGFDDIPMRMDGGKPRRVVLSGDVMLDNTRHFAAMAAERSTVMQRLGLEPGQFVLCTVHRDHNTDHPARLQAIVSAVLHVAHTHRITVVLPLHPRTRKLLPQQLSAELLQRFTQSPYIKMVPPASFFDIIELERHARIVITDSGGVQKEAFFLETPCVIMLHETPWVEIVEHGAGICADADYDRICQAYEQLAGKPVQFPPLFGDGHAARHILSEIESYFHDR